MDIWCSDLISYDATAFLGYVLPWGQMSFEVLWLSQAF
jgi:quinol-cytochrome oxidoreductase complex cytochrome b subunit